jgi:ABC-2 type transport system ATP-binding protein
MRALDVVRVVPLVRDASLYGVKIHVLVDDSATARGPLQAAVEAAGVGLRRIAPIAPTLEDIFVAIVSHE